MVWKTWKDISLQQTKRSTSTILSSVSEKDMYGLIPTKRERPVLQVIGVKKSEIKGHRANGGSLHMHIVIIF